VILLPQISNGSLIRACLFSAIAGSIVTLIAQFGALTGIIAIDWLQLGFAFLAPLVVSIATVSAHVPSPDTRHVTNPIPQPTLILEPRYAIVPAAPTPDPAYDISGALTTITQIKDNAINVNQSSMERLSFIGDLIARCESINANAAKLNADADDTYAAIESVRTTTQQVTGSFNNLRQDTAIVVDDVTKFIAIADDVSTQFTSVKDATATLNQLGMKVRLLSLNASVEAARAGDAGRGFSVIAEEIRTLAEQSNIDTATIAEVIGTLEATLKSLSSQVAGVENRLRQTYTRTEESYQAAERAEMEVQGLGNQLSNFSASMSAQLPGFTALTEDMNQIKANTEAAVTGSANNIALCKKTLRSLAPIQTDFRKAS
jgi:methyl-accepting chemotaxis protein